MLTDQAFFQSERNASDAKGQVPLQTSVEFIRAYNAQAHEIVDAITAAVTGAQAGLNWLRAEPPDLEEVRRSLIGIASDGKRAAKIVVQLRALMKKVSTAELLILADSSEVAGAKSPRDPNSTFCE